ncbi:membrane protein [Caballeronia hypogeia]|uniref:Membrane protein n=1 Tax=Caballeronia hypogeia TaxID=1777140 RepID=A0A158BNU0_9BURK|nr:DUF4148 domain-containing protein [Caballeronia hypogeia]SAK71681.1 membrane protein [Caballeronia hypogeia]
MKSFVKAVAVAAVVVAPAISFAQTGSTVTRSEVKQDLQRVEAAGYDPARSDQTSYPADIKAAEKRASSQSNAYNADMNSYGGAAAGRSAAGTRTMMPPMDNDRTKPTYLGR